MTAPRVGKALYHRSVSVRPAIYQRLREAAARRGCSVAKLVERALVEFADNDQSTQDGDL